MLHIYTALWGRGSGTLTASPTLLSAGSGRSLLGCRTLLESCLCEAPCLLGGLYLQGVHKAPADHAGAGQHRRCPAGVLAPLCTQNNRDVTAWQVNQKLGKWGLASTVMALQDSGLLSADREPHQHGAPA